MKTWGFTLLLTSVLQPLVLCSLSKCYHLPIIHVRIQGSYSSLIDNQRATALYKPTQSSLHSGQHVNSILGKARKLYIVLPHTLATLFWVLKLHSMGCLSLGRQKMIHQRVGKLTPPRRRAPLLTGVLPHLKPRIGRPI